MREVENNKSEDGKEDENNMTTPSAFETAETPTTTKKSAAKNNVRSYVYVYVLFLLSFSMFKCLKNF